ELGSVAIVRKKHEGAYINQHLALFRCNQERCSPSFLVHFLSTAIAREQFGVHGQGGTKQGLGFEQVGAVKFALPPAGEQARIAAYCDNVWDDFVSLASSVRRSLCFLSEYRSALI